MGLNYRRRVHLGRNTWLNLSGSGVSVSHRKGRTTFNSRGSVWVRLFRGLFWRS